MLDVEWILIKDFSKEWHFIPIITTVDKYDDKIKHLIVSIRRQLELALGSYYCWESSPTFSVIANKGKSLDLDAYIRFAAKVKSTGEYVTLSIFDNLDPSPNNIKIAQYKQKKMMCKYNNCTFEELDDDTEYKLPKNITSDWEAFKSLWEDTFCQAICPYAIITSNGLEGL